LGRHSAALRPTEGAAGGLGSVEVIVGRVLNWSLSIAKAAIRRALELLGVESRPVRAAPTVHQH